MALQSRNLVMTGLGVLGDAPPNDLQPPLRDGIHLRWSFQRERGFPWHGYYLFRRQHREPRLLCLGEILRELQLQPGGLGTATLNTPRGQIVSDRLLVLTDAFPPPALVEFDLRGRSYLRFSLPPGELAYQAQVTLGFLTGEGEGGRLCPDLAEVDEAAGPSFVLDDVSFEVLDHAGNPWPGPLRGAFDGRPGLNVGFTTRVKLPCPASRVSLTLFHSALPAKVVALDETGNEVDAAEMNARLDTLVLTGPGIVTLFIDAPQDETLLLELCYVCAGEAPEAAVEVRALAGGVPVVTRVLSGVPGEVVIATLDFDALTAIECGGGPAVVIDVCWARIDASALRGWEPLPDFTYPLCLPVAHPDYPCVNKPASRPVAEDVAAGRVSYGDPDDWRGAHFTDLHGQLSALVAGGPPPGGEPMAQRAQRVPGVPLNPDGTRDPEMREQYPLDLVLAGTLNPAIAQMVGLYWLDQAADPGVAYDYLILADYDGQLGDDPAKALHWLATAPDFSRVDGYIVFNKRVAPAPPLPPPGGLRAYALPGSTMVADNGAALDATNNAGLRWDLGLVGSVLLPGKPVLYHVWRADLGGSEPGAPSRAGDYQPVTKERPIVVVQPRLAPGITPQFPADWPPFSLGAIDRGLPEGWYSYRVNGIDIFGRHSLHSSAAPWFQWAPQPQPRPWYYNDPPGDTQVHPYAVGLLDKIAPPPPAAIEAYALDPQDATLVRDAAYNAWQASLTPAERASLIGLRLRWRWTFRHMQQAPDAQEFRVYYEPGPLNTLLGRITAVTAAGAGESLVDTDIAHAQATDAFAGTRLRVGADSFRILGSQAGTPLRLRVQNIGPGDDVRPPAGASCSLVIPEGHALFADYSVPTTWGERYHVVGFNQNVTPTTDADGNPLRIYEIFLPASGGAGLPLSPTLAQPIVYAHIGVSAADDKTHTPDAAQWGGTTWGDRPGNEGRVGGPVTLYRVRRVQPPAPVPPPDAERVFATSADYHGRSYYTYRWQPSPHLKTHIFRALDDAVFKADWAQRAAAAPTIAASDEQLFPVELRGANPGIVARRGQIAAELNQLNGFSHDEAGTQAAMAHYRGLSNDALRVLAGLSWTEPAFTQITILPLDPADPALANRPGPDNPPDLPIDPALRIYIDALDGRATNRTFYRSAYVDGAHNRSAHLSLASPPVYCPDVRPPRQPQMHKVLGGDRRVTVTWKTPPDTNLLRQLVYRTDNRAAGRDIRLMGAPVADLPAEPLVTVGGAVDVGAGTDVVTVERVYAAAGFDPQADLLNGQTAAQFLPAPAPPAGSRATGLTAPNGTAVVVVYTDSRGTLQYTPWGTAPRAWVNSGLAGATTYFYRVVTTRAGETAGGLTVIQSSPSHLGAGRAVDLTPPDPPTWTRSEWVRVDPDGNEFPFADPIPAGASREPAVALTWMSTSSDLAVLVQQRRDHEAVFSNVTGWLPRGTNSYLARGLSPHVRYRFRLLVLSQSGNRNEAFNLIRVDPVVNV